MAKLTFAMLTLRRLRCEPSTAALYTDKASQQRCADVDPVSSVDPVSCVGCLLTLPLYLAAHLSAWSLALASYRTNSSSNTGSLADISRYYRVPDRAKRSRSSLSNSSIAARTLAA